MILECKFYTYLVLGILFSLPEWWQNKTGRSSPFEDPSLPAPVQGTLLEAWSPSCLGCLLQESRSQLPFKVLAPEDWSSSGFGCLLVGVTTPGPSQGTVAWGLCLLQVSEACLQDLEAGRQENGRWRLWPHMPKSNRLLELRRLTTTGGETGLLRLRSSVLVSLFFFTQPRLTIKNVHLVFECG